MTVVWNITFKPAFSGKAYNTYLKAVDDSGSIAAWAKKGTYTVNRAPGAGVISPSSGTVNTDTMLTFGATYIDEDNWQNIQYVYLLINISTAKTNCFYGYYDQNANKLYLRNDANTAWLGGFAPGTANVIENSYAKLHCDQTSVTGAGTTMTVSWAITFKSTFVGAKKSYLYVNDDVGANSGYVQKGTITVQLPADTTPPTITSVTPTDSSLLYANQTVAVAPVVIDNDPSPLTYQFGVDGVTKQAWSGNATFNWATTLPTQARTS